MRIVSHYDNRCNTGHERHFADVVSLVQNGDVVLVHYKRIDDFTELHGLREVFEDYIQHQVDVWICDGETVRRRTVHRHDDYVLGDQVQGLNHGGIWKGEMRSIYAPFISADGTKVGFTFNDKPVEYAVA